MDEISLEEFKSKIEDLFQYPFDEDEDDEIVCYSHYYPIGIVLYSKERIFEIFYNCTFISGEGLEQLRYNFSSQEEIIHIAQFLFDRIQLKPEIRLDNRCMICPGEDVHVGYFNLELDTNFMAKFFKNIEDFCNCDINKNSILKRGIENFVEEAQSHKELHSELIKREEEKFRSFCKINGFDELKKRAEKVKRNIFIVSSKVTIFGLHENIPKDIFERYGPAKHKIREHYKGVRYFFAKHKDRIIAVNMPYLQKFKELLYALEFSYYADTEYMTDGKNYVLLRKNTVWAIIMCHENSQEAILEEFNLLEKLINDFKPFAPKKIEEKIDWSKISPEKFEELCQEFLIVKGFKDVKLRGKTNCPDRGVDITAKDEYKSVIGNETRNWIFQCKHSKKSISRKDIAEIPLLLEEFNAGAYGLLCTSALSTQTIERLNSFSEKKGVMIKNWSSRDLEIELNNYPDILTKYGLKLFKI